MASRSALRVLVADDQLTMRTLIRQSLSQLGINDVTLASDGEQALRVMLAGGPNLIISDYNMPKFDGLQLLRAVRSQEAIRKTAFIMLTGQADADLVTRAVQHGVNNYLVKPFSTESLQKKIEAVVGVLT